MSSRDIHDHYFHQAKREGYRSRAAYKLLEIHKKKHLFRKGDAVLDCGCAPGSWLQVAAECVGSHGVVVGVDLNPVQPSLPEVNIHTIEGDLREIAPGELLSLLNEGGTESGFNVVLSDMAPSTTGERILDHHRSVRLCDAVLDRCPVLLRPGGNLVMKVFEGEAYRDLMQRMKEAFVKVKGFRPPASRSESTEIYLIGHEYQACVKKPENDSHPAPPPAPPTGWGA